MMRMQKILKKARHHPRNVFLISVLCGIGLVIGSWGGGIPLGYAAEAFPSGKITWIVGFQPGGGEDIMARGIAPYLEKYLKAVSPKPGFFDGYIVFNKVQFLLDRNHVFSFIQ